MIQVKKLPLSEFDKDKLQTWLTLPAADLFMNVIRSEQSEKQAQAAYVHMSKDRNLVAAPEALSLFREAAELEAMIEKITAFRRDDYVFETVTLTP